jgi:anti-sigma regulatory factor (Ser/Thr protein kinase)
MSEPTQELLAVRYPEDVGQARREGKAFAALLGFEAQACEEIALAVAELASNLLKHAGGGTLELIPLQADGRVGLGVESADCGPGIADIAQAVADGFSTAGSRGVGLGVVNRLMDEFAVDSRRGRGTRVVCRKWIRHYPASLRDCPLDIGVASRPRRWGECNGDAFVIKHWSESVLVGVIDGLGHGPLAHQASECAKQYVETHYDQPLGDIFLGAGRACQSTRGVVMALAHFDWGRGMLSFASVGNIEARIFPHTAAFNLNIRRGIIGLNAPSPKLTEHLWHEANLMVLHSDGLKTLWGWNDFPNVQAKPAETVAQEFLRALAKDDDDATVLVVKGRIR